MPYSKTWGVLVCVAVTVAGCGERAPAPPGTTAPVVKGYPAGWPSAADRTLAPGKAPTPYTADQIRLSCAPDRRYTFRSVDEGKPPATRQLRFTGGDANAAKFELAVGERDDDPALSWRAVEVPWKGLQSHGSFDAASTTITFERVVVPEGTHDAVLYAVRDDIKKTLTKHWFALDLPGPPVKTVVTMEGKVVSETELLRTAKGS
jgi:hypothetical protein